MGEEREPDLMRRGVVVGLAAAAATAAAPPIGDDGAHRPTVNTTLHHRPAGDDVQRFLGPIQSGYELGGGWSVDRVYDVHFGAISLTLFREGASAAVDMLRIDAEALSTPIATSGYTALYLANRAEGSTPTPEGAGLAIMALARIIEGREDAGARPPSLLTLEERLTAHSLRSLQVPV